MYCYLIEDFRFSDDTPTFSCFLAFTQDHTDVLLFNRGFSVSVMILLRFLVFLPLHRTTQMYCYLIEDFPVSVMIRLRFLVFLPLHRTTQMYCYLIEDFPVSVMMIHRTTDVRFQ